MNTTKLLIGSDPEIFLETSNGEFINAFNGFLQDIVTGNKEHPEITDYGAIQVDGMAIELNTKPTADPVEFSSLIAAGIKDAARRFNGVPSLECVKQFDIDWLSSQHPLAIELGCDPDYNAWEDGAINQRPDMMIPMRTAGGHVHIGWGNGLDTYSPEHITYCCSVVKQMDYVLGLWALKYDTRGAMRRSLYGNPGAFRPKPYGVEYRVLSNFWIFDKDRCEDIVKRTTAGMRALSDNKCFADQYGELARHAVSTDGIENVLAEIEAVLVNYI